jgi:hypothetical protein
LYRLGDLHNCITEETQIEIGDIIDEAYESWKQGRYDGKQSGDSTDGGSDPGGERKDRKQLSLSVLH